MLTKSMELKLIGVFGLLIGVFLLLVYEYYEVSLSISVTKLIESRIFRTLEEQDLLVFERQVLRMKRLMSAIQRRAI